MKKNLIGHKEIEKLFNVKLSDYVKSKINSYKLVYSTLNEDEKEKVIIKIIDTLLDPSVSYSGPHRLKQWEKGWGQNLVEFKEGKDIDNLTPHYINKYEIFRLNQMFIKGVSPNFERGLRYIILDYIFDKYLRQAENIYEFGCGTGLNLLKIREVNPSANLFGLDWAKSSQKILREMCSSNSIKNIKEYNFDFFKPDRTIKFADNSVMLTITALEQVGSNYEKFVSYLLENKPSICIHIEPIAELLNEDRLIDYLSIRYFQKRNYLDGYLDYLKKLEKEKKIKIIEVKRTYIGTLFVEQQSIIVWKPIFKR